MSSLLHEHDLHVGFANLPWQVHKFGGTSVATADCYRTCARIVEEQIGIQHTDNENKPVNCPHDHFESLKIAVVVSAMGGKPKTTDLLLDSVKYASMRMESEKENVLTLIMDKHKTCLQDLFADDNSHECERLTSIIEQDLMNIRDILKTVSLMKWEADRIRELVSGFGELWSAQILTSLLNQRQREREDLVESTPSMDDDTSSRSTSQRKNQPVFVYLDARRVITIDEEAIQNGAVVWETSQEKLQALYDEECALLNNKDKALHFIMTGYVAVNTQGVSTTLQRDGSDYSAAILGRLLKASSIAIWTDVDGVLSADPRRVPLAQVLPEVSYNEAMELAYFGAKVIHPKTMQPAIECNPQIPIYIRNTFHSSFRGSRIFTSSTSHTDREKVVCGFSSIERIAMINVEGSGMIGVPGVMTRLFGALQKAGVNVILISQASSEHSVTFATTQEQARDAKEALEEEFHRELRLSRISAIDINEPCSIIAAVGDGMAKTTGCSARFFSALGDAKINIIAIAQGCSERNISAVVKMEDSTRALRAVHAAFRLSHTTIRIGLLGSTNPVGESLLRLLETQRNMLRTSFDIDLQVCAVLPMATPDDDSLVCLKNDTDGGSDSITIGAYNNVITGSKLGNNNEEQTTTTSFADESCATLVHGGPQALLEAFYKAECTNHVVFDCTNDESVSKYHASWLKATVDVVTANNTGLSGSKEQRDEIAVAERFYGKESASYLREVTVGGGLPIVKTLRSLIHSGDRIRRLDGIFSVSLSYIMFRISPPTNISECSQYDEESSNGAFTGDLSADPSIEVGNACSFSQAVKEATVLGLMEYDDYTKDLNNEYTSRVLMVLARELGLDKGIELHDIQEKSDKILEVMLGTDLADYNISPEMDQKIKERVDAARSRGCVLRHVSTVDVGSRHLSTKLVEVPDHHTFAITPPSCNCFRFFTKRHLNYPLIVKGPGAGADATASALLAELINLMSSKASPNSVALSRSESGAALRASILSNSTGSLKL